MAQLRSMPGERYELVATGFAELPTESRKNPGSRVRFVAGAIKRILKSQPFKGRQCVLCLPAETTFVQHIKMAKMPDDQLAEALRWELQGKLPYDPSRAIIRHVIAGETFNSEEVKQEVVVLAANREVVESHIALAKRSKLDCVGINVEPCAIVECFARLFRRADDASRTTLFIDIGSTSTQVVVSHGPQLVFARNIFVGGVQFDQAIADGLQMPLEQAIAFRRQNWGGEDDPARSAKAAVLLARPIDELSAELTRCLQYYDSVFNSRPLERVVFLGGQAYDKRVCQMLAQRIGLPAQIGDPLARVNRAPDALEQIGVAGEGSLPDWAVAVGLSLGADVRAVAGAA